MWLALLVVLFYPLRYLVCACCPYYGQDCSTSMGKSAPKLFKKQEGKSMKLGLRLDVVLFILLFGIPLLLAWQMGGARPTAVWPARPGTASGPEARRPKAWAPYKVSLGAIEVSEGNLSLDALCFQRYAGASERRRL